MNIKSVPAFLLLMLITSQIQAETQRLINTRDMYPSASPDGKQLVFQSNRTGNNQIFIMNMDGSGLKQLGDFPLGAETPVFSPDGQRIVFDVYIGEDNNDVFVINSDGSGLKQLTESPGYDGHPHWSADGKRIAFASNRTGPANTGQIWLVNPDGSQLKQLSFGPWSHAQPAWSFDGQYIYAYQLKETADYEFGSVVRITLKN